MAETKKRTTKKKPVEAEVVVPETNRVRVIAHALNVRKSGSYDAEIVKVIKVDEVREIVNEVNGWGEIADGEGWICLDFVTKIEA